MENQKIFIDFDGVIFDTEERIIERKNLRKDLEWNEFFNELDWFKLMEESKVINNAIEYILQAQESQKQMQF